MSFPGIPGAGSVPGSDVAGMSEGEQRLVKQVRGTVPPQIHSHQT